MDPSAAMVGGKYDRSEDDGRLDCRGRDAFGVGPCFDLTLVDGCAEKDSELQCYRVAFCISNSMDLDIFHIRGEQRRCIAIVCFAAFVLSLSL